VTSKELKYFEKKLLAERKKLLSELGHLEREMRNQTPKDLSGDLSAYSFHPADLGTDTMEREKEFFLFSTEGSLLSEIDEALRRLYNKSFGNCERCGRRIEKARLNAVPYARLCLKCQEEIEREKREF